MDDEMARRLSKVATFRDLRRLSVADNPRLGIKGIASILEAEFAPQLETGCRFGLVRRRSCPTVGGISTFVNHPPVDESQLHRPRLRRIQETVSQLFVRRRFRRTSVVGRRRKTGTRGTCSFGEQKEGIASRWKRLCSRRYRDRSFGRVGNKGLQFGQ